MKKIFIPILILMQMNSLMGQSSEFPKVVNLRADMPSIRDQEERSSCSFFAAISCVEYEYNRIYNKQVNLSEEFVCYNTKKYYDIFNNSEESASFINFHAIIQHGLVFESQWPYSNSYFSKGYPCEKLESDSVIPGYCYTQMVPSLDVHKQVFFPNAKVKNIDGTGFLKDAVIKELATKKKPIVFTFPYNANNWPDDGKIFYNAEMDSLDEINGCSYHIATICGYDLNKEQFLIRNSWGKSWGTRGYGTLSFDDFAYAQDCYCFEMFDEPGKAKDPKCQLPKFEKHEKMSLKSFDVLPTINNDHSISLSITGEVDDIGWRVLEINSILKTIPNDGKLKFNMVLSEEIVLTEAEEKLLHDWWARIVKIFLPHHSFKSNLKWPKHAPIQLQYPAEMILSESVQKAVNDDTKRIILQTTLYYLDDTDGLVNLKRVLIELDKSLLKAQ